MKQIASRKDCATLVAASASSADHMLRIRPKSALIDISAPEVSIESYQNDYAQYFERNKANIQPGYSSHGNDPRVLLVPKVGAITTGNSLNESLMLADIAFHTHSVAARVIDSFGEADTIPESEIFGFDYWPMELFKLASKPAPAQFAGSIYVVTGAGSGIGRGIALELARLGASITLADLDEKGLEEVASVFREKIP